MRGKSGNLPSRRSPEAGTSLAGRKLMFPLKRQSVVRRSGGYPPLDQPFYEVCVGARAFFWKPI